MLRCKCCIPAELSPWAGSGAQHREEPWGAMRAPRSLQLCSRYSGWDQPAETHTHFFVNGKMKLHIHMLLHLTENKQDTFLANPISRFVCFKSLIVFPNCKKSRLNSRSVVEIIHDNKLKNSHKVAIAISLLQKDKFRYSLSMPRKKLSQRKIFLYWYENRPVCPPGTLCAVTPGSWSGKEKKEDKGVNAPASPLRQQEKEIGFQINVQ